MSLRTKYLCILRVQISAAYTGKCFQKPCVQPTRLCFWGVQKLFQGWNVSASRRHRLCVCSFHTLSLFPGYSMHIKNREVNVSPFSWVLCCWNSWTWKILTDDCHQNEISWVISQAHQSRIRKQYIKYSLKSQIKAWHFKQKIQPFTSKWPFQSQPVSKSKLD